MYTIIKIDKMNKARFPWVEKGLSGIKLYIPIHGLYVEVTPEQPTWVDGLDTIENSKWQCIATTKEEAMEGIKRKKQLWEEVNDRVVKKIGTPLYDTQVIPVVDNNGKEHLVAKVYTTPRVSILIEV